MTGFCIPEKCLTRVTAAFRSVTEHPLRKRTFRSLPDARSEPILTMETVLSIDASRYNNEVCRISVNDIEEFSKDSISYLNKNGKRSEKKYRRRHRRSTTADCAALT